MVSVCLVKRMAALSDTGKYRPLAQQGGRAQVHLDGSSIPEPEPLLWRFFQKRLAESPRNDYTRSRQFHLQYNFPVENVGGGQEKEDPC